MIDTDTLPEGHFLRRVAAGEFLFGGEIEYSRSLDMGHFLAQAQFLRGHVDFLTIPDNPGSNIAISNLAIAQHIRPAFSTNAILSLSCRDHNRLGLASAVASAVATGFTNLLLVTGDHPTLGPFPQSMPVFDLDSTQLLALCQEFRRTGCFYGEQFNDTADTEKGLHLTSSLVLGSVVNPNSTYPEIELLKLQRKAGLGLDFFQSQIIFDIELVKPFFQQLRKLKIPVFVGIAPMQDYAVAKHIAQFLPGMEFHADVLNAYKKIWKDQGAVAARQEAFDAFNLQFYVPLLSELKRAHLIEGVYFATVDYPRIISKIVAAVQ